MSRLTRAFAIVCLPSTLLAQGKFEGAITAHIASVQGGADVTYLVKGDQFRMDMSGRGGQTVYILRDQAKNSTLMVMPSQRMYMETPMAALNEATGANGKAPDIKMTGRKETIAGIECEHAVFSTDDGQFDACVAHGIGAFPMTSNPMAGRGRASDAQANWQRALGRDAFPLKVQKVGGETVFEVTKIEKKPLDASLFAVPEGFQKMDLGRMGRPPLL